ncbi:MAG: dihydroorotate dehydrogenase [bacterium]|nr:dihydroorotate dehydrogenase [bacterium]
MELKTTLGSIELEHPIMNAAGPRCKTIEEVRILARTPVAAIVVGSITKEPRPGNQGDVYHSGPNFSLNSLGLPNGGWTYYYEHLPEMVDIARQAGKILIVSIAGFSPEEYDELANKASQRGLLILRECNLGCPNVWSDGKQKRIASFDPLLVERILQAGWYDLVKVSPFSDPTHLAEIASVISKSTALAVTVANTFPNAFALQEDGRSAISPQFSDGLAGMAGPALKAINMGQVLQWKKLLPKHIAVIGAGGIRTGQDVKDYLKAGASAVQIATAYADEGAGVFDRILMEYVALIEAETPVAP